jgi:cytochrome c oxidase subunit 2
VISRGKKVLWTAAGLAAAFFMSACASVSTPQSALNPQGPVAHKENDLFWLAVVISCIVFVIVEGLLIFFLFRYRHRKKATAEELPPQIEGNTRLEIGWTMIPVILLIIVAVPTVGLIFQLARKPAGDPLTVQVGGHQWWWEFRYPQQGVTTANQMVIPVDRPVYIQLYSSGQTSGGTPIGIKGQPAPAVGYAVIHGFWVPGLAGKQDVVPGQTNTMWLEASKVGTYDGQCSAFCGFSHANMHFQVVVLSESDWNTWMQDQQQQSVAPQSGSLAAQGLQIFTGQGGMGSQCMACHTITGTSAQGVGGPNLTHLMSRSCFAGCSFPINAKNLSTWLADPQAMKPGALMPNLHLSQSQIQALVAYLTTLK